MSAQASLGDLTRESFRIGCLGFGGPAGQIALMHRVYVDEKKWIDDTTFAQSLNYCTLLPGPEAQQLATYLGWRWHGALGGVISGALFVLPGALVMIALAWAYALYGTLPASAAIFLGIKAAVVALVAEALWKISKRALKTRVDLIIALVSFVALLLFNLPFPLVVLVAGIVGYLRPRTAATSAAPAVAPVKASIAGSLRAALVWGAAWFAPLTASALVLGPDHVLTKVGVFFSKMAIVTFGGAYATLAYVQQEAVATEGWLTAPQMLDGFGLAETTPGPLVLVNQFVGFLAGWQSEGGGLWLALLAAVMTSWCTFAPSFVWIFAGAPYAERLNAFPPARGALSAITAAVLGVIAVLAVSFATAVLFKAQLNIATPWGHTLHVPDVTAPNLPAILIALVCAAALIRFKVNVLWVIAGAALAGYAFGVAGMG